MTAVLLVVVGIAVWFAIPKKQVPAGSQRFYSDDDGTTWFADDVTKLAPFPHKGREAVMARVYQTEGGKQFVAYLEKYTDEQRQKLESKGQAPPHKPGVSMTKAAGRQASGLLVKKPHEGAWVPAEDPAAKSIQTVVGPDGSTGCTPCVPE